MSSIEPRPSRQASLYDWVVVLTFFAAIPAIAYAVLNVRSDTASVARWLPIGTGERQKYDQFVELFGADDFLLISWDGCRPDDPRLTRYAAALRRELADAEVGAPVVARVTTTRDLLDSLEEPPLDLPAREARRRIAGFMLGKDLETAAVLVEASAEGARRQKFLVDEIYSLAAREIDVAPDRLYVGGTIFEAVTIDRESFASLKNFVIPSALAVVVLALAMVRDIRLVAIMLLVSVFCQGVSVAVLYYWGASLDAVLIIMPTLVYVTTMSSALHLINYYRHSADLKSPDPAGASLKHGWKPCVGASLTTAIGLGSLALSQVEPVRMFGIYSAIGVTIALGIALLVIPSALRVMHTPKPRPLPASISGDSATAELVGGWISRWSSAITVVSLAVTFAVGWGVTRLESSLNLQQMFPPESRLVQNYQWLEAHVGPLISIETLVSFPRGGEVDRLRQLEALDAIQRRVLEFPEVQSTTSVLTYAPPISRSGALRAVAQRAMLRRYLEDHRADLESQRVLVDDGGRDVWRITARVSALQGLEYGDLASVLEQGVEQLIEKMPTDIREHIGVEFTGLTPIVYRAQDQILADLFNSFLGAFALIAPLMMLHVRSVIGGLIAMIPNVAPVVIAFGALGWLSIPVNIGIVLTASVGLGIAVDGTLHFVGWYRDRRRLGYSPLAAVVSSLHTCGPALIQATLVVGLGLLVYALSSFIPTVRFTWLLLALLLVALVADLVLMPALLLGPLGRFFQSGLSHAVADEPVAEIAAKPAI